MQLTCLAAPKTLKLQVVGRSEKRSEKGDNLEVQKILIIVGDNREQACYEVLI